MNNKSPRIQIWFPDEIDNITLAVFQSSFDVAKYIPGNEIQYYILGFTNAINQLRTAVDLPPLVANKEK